MVKQKIKQMMKIVNNGLKQNKDRDVLRSLLIIKAELEILNTQFIERRCEL